jgi:hypothetical protein
MTTKYIVTEEPRTGGCLHDNMTGKAVYSILGCDYGCANDDSRHFGVEHISVTLDPDGGYPFFTIPKHVLALATGKDEK